MLMRYVVIEEFTDLQDNNKKYLAGEEYPRKGFSVNEARLAELSGDKNRRGRAMIKAVADVTPEIVEVKAAEPVAGFMPEPEPVADVIPEPAKRGRKKK